MGDNLKRNRTTCKSVFTRSVNSLEKALEREYPKGTIEKKFVLLKERFEAVRESHRIYG